MLKTSQEHLVEVHETYGEHLRAALVISGLLAKAGLACAVHAFIPGMCTRTASRCVTQIFSHLEERGAVVANPGQYEGVARRTLS